MSMAIGTTVMGDIISKSPIPIVKGELTEPKAKDLGAAGFSTGTYSKELDEYRKWI